VKKALTGKHQPQAISFSHAKGSLREALHFCDRAIIVPHQYLLASPSTVYPAGRLAMSRPAPAVRDQRRAIGIGMIGSGVALALLMRHAGLTIDPLSAGNLPYVVCGTLALALRLWAGRLPWRHGVALANGAEYYALFTLIALIGAVASYPIAALTSGFHDATLQRIDESLGFDWLAWYRAVADHPLLQHAGLIAYRSIYATPAVLLGYFAWKGERIAAHRFLATFWLTALVTLLLYGFMPAVGPFAYLWHAAIPYMPESELWQPGLIPALRDHSVRVVDLAHLRGIVSAPSFHAAAAAIYIQAAWRLRELRWPVLGVAGAMLLATPVEGTHYLADILLGLAVAIGAIVTLNRLMPER
jgi:hypothetical protein